MKEEDVFALFCGGNRYRLSLIIKHDGIIYELVTIESIIDENPQITWQTLGQNVDDAKFVDNKFRKMDGDMRYYKHKHLMKALDNTLLCKDEEIATLDQEYQRKLCACHSLKELKIARNKFEKEYLTARKQLMNDKIRIIDQIKTKSDQRKDELENKLSATQKNLAEINEAMDDLNAQISKLQAERGKKIKQLHAAMEIQNAENKLLTEHKAEDNKYSSIFHELDDDLKDIECSESKIAMESFQTALTIEEKKYKEWSTQTVIEWLLLIENGRFCQDKYRKLLGGIEKLKVDGSSFKDLQNDSLLKLVSDGSLDDDDRQILIKNVDRVLNSNKEQRKDGCTICVDGKINSVFIPCGHQAACYECYEIDNDRFRRCPICRKEITNVVKTFMNGF